MASATTDPENTIIPARLSFLAIYNPSLGRTDETFRDQIVFYHSRLAYERRKQGQHDDQQDPILQEEENEQLRQIGLAQGMINFAQNFANGSIIDNVETEKSRIILHELEEGWWILASIDLTRIPLAQISKTSSTKSSDAPQYEYSAREISPPALITEQLVRAHAVFKLHNGHALSNLHERHGRAKFCTLLDQFWTKFAINWDVMLHGVPAVEIFGSMHLAAGGELGLGLGDEEWGAGEREVLEDFTKRTEGLIDVLVSRFGDAPDSDSPANEEPWMGVGRLPSSADGIIFSGVGAVTRPCIRDISHWMQWIYTYGEGAYGVKESPSPNQKRPRKRDIKQSSTTSAASSRSPGDAPTGIPRSIVSAAEKSLATATTKAQKRSDSKDAPSNHSLKPTTRPRGKSDVREQDTWKKVLSLGYGSAWSFTGQSSGDTEPPPDKITARLEAQIKRENTGHFVVGLQGNPGDEEDAHITNESKAGDWNRRIMIRGLHVDAQGPVRPGLARFGTSKSSNKSKHVQSSSPNVDSRPDKPSLLASVPVKTTSRIRVLIYVHRPFIYALLFEPEVASLMMPSFYRDIHTFLSPLHPLLLRRTGAALGSERRRYQLRGPAYDSSPDEQGRTSSKWRAAETINEYKDSTTWEVVYDSATLSTIASVPGVDGDSGSISRGEALNLHSAALEVLASVQEGEVERRVKTARGWWIGWARVAAGDDAEGGDTDATPIIERDEMPPSNTDSKSESSPERTGREILLFRRAQDVASSGKSRLSAGWGLTGGSEDSKLDGKEMGLAFDAKKYIESIMGLGK